MGSGADSDPMDRQPGGDHYRKYAIQPIEYIVKNKLSFLAGNVVKYVTRYKDKGGTEDIHKAIHYLDLILEFEYANKQEHKVNDNRSKVGSDNRDSGSEGRQVD